MPFAAPRMCPRPGCVKLGKHSHKREIDDSRQSAWKRGYNTHHRRWRTQVLNRAGGWCQACDNAPATEADHIIPLATGGGWSLSNGQALCKRCHSRKTYRETLLNS